jgi:hypothetical protein
LAASVLRIIDGGIKFLDVSNVDRWWLDFECSDVRDRSSIAVPAMNSRKSGSALVKGWSYRID